MNGHTNLCRKRSAHKNDFAVSANMAYGEVNLKPGMISMEGEYENPDKILKPSGQWNETTAVSNSYYETIETNKQPALEDASTDDSVCQK